MNYTFIRQPPFRGQHPNQPPGLFTVHHCIDGVSSKVSEFHTQEEAVNDAESRGLPNIRVQFECIRCKLQTFNEFMVHPYLWRQAGLGRGGVHIQCFQILIGRPLTLADFTSAAMNNPLRFAYAMGRRDATQVQFTGPIRCGACDHTWVGSSPCEISPEFVECPKCHEEVGSMEFDPAVLLDSAAGCG